jgi:hypothetical protein
MNIKEFPIGTIFEPYNNNIEYAYSAWTEKDGFCDGSVLTRKDSADINIGRPQLIGFGMWLEKEVAHFLARENGYGGVGAYWIIPISEFEKITLTPISFINNEFLIFN